MKYLFRWFLLLLLWFFLWANFWFNFTKNISIQAVEDMFWDLYSWVVDTYSGSSIDDTFVSFQDDMKDYFISKKDQIADEMKKWFIEALKKKMSLTD